MSRKILREIVASCIMCGNPIYGMKETTEDNPEVKRTCFCVPVTCPVYPTYWSYPNTWQTFTIPAYTGITYQGNTACASQ